MITRPVRLSDISITVTFARTQHAVTLSRTWISTVRSRPPWCTGTCAIHVITRCIVLTRAQLRAVSSIESQGTCLWAHGALPACGTLARACHVITRYITWAITPVKWDNYLTLSKWRSSTRSSEVCRSHWKHKHCHNALHWSLDTTSTQTSSQKQRIYSLGLLSTEFTTLLASPSESACCSLNSQRSGSFQDQVQKVLEELRHKHTET